MPLPVGIKDDCFITHVCVSLCVIPNIDQEKCNPKDNFRTWCERKGKSGALVEVVHPQHTEIFYQWCLALLLHGDSNNHTNFNQTPFILKLFTANVPPLFLACRIDCLYNPWLQSPCAFALEQQCKFQVIMYQTLLSLSVKITNHLWIQCKPLWNLNQSQLKEEKY